MLPHLRQELILEILKQNKSATLRKLVVATKSSEATVRRDLESLEKRSLLRRTRGGAVYREEIEEEPGALVRMSESKDKKERIAVLALRLLENGKTFFFDSSSTVSALSKIFAYDYRTVMTTGLNCALTLAQKENLHILLPGGTVSFHSNSVGGALAVTGLASFNPDVAVFSCGGIAGGTVTEASGEQAEIKKTAFANASVKILLVDSGKFEKRLPFTWGKSEDFDYVVTDRKPPLSLVGDSRKTKWIHP